jgi:hypothetical protein
VRLKKQVKNKSKIRYCNMKNLIVVTNLSKRQKNHLLLKATKNCSHISLILDYEYRSTLGRHDNIYYLVGVDAKKVL